MTTTLDRHPLCFSSGCVCTQLYEVSTAQKKKKKKNQVSLVCVSAQVAASLPFSHLTPTVNQSEIRKGHLLLTWSPGWQGRSCHQGHRSSWAVSCGSLPRRGCFPHRCYGRCATKVKHNILLQWNMMNFWQIDLKERIRYLPGEVHLLCLECLQQIQWKSKNRVTLQWAKSGKNQLWIYCLSEYWVSTLFGHKQVFPKQHRMHFVAHWGEVVVQWAKTSTDFLLLGRIKFSNNSVVLKTSHNFCGCSVCFLKKCVLCECTWAPIWLSPAVVMVAAFSQHAVRAVWERGEQPSRGWRLQAWGTVRARHVGCRTGLWKRHHTGAGSTDSYRSELLAFTSDVIEQHEDILMVDLPRNCRTLVRVLLWAALVLGRRVPWPSDTLNMSKPNTHILQISAVSVKLHGPSGDTKNGI